MGNLWPARPRPQVDSGATLANATRVAGHAYEKRHIADHIRAKGIDLIEEAGNTDSSIRPRSQPPTAGPGTQTG